ncbi:uncharacterized protein LOC128557964 [Mercenaria mercenaria]|uniref:uncharacterized protein LOC128557964 n=1 Tax=Mercenaria mercenaria TaxID=6596 RepID=UPI00234EF67F|nr:uncharacterized protein LOC128557964 [Mercenaria mercenaria]
MTIIDILKALGLAVTIVILLVGAISVFARLRKLENMDPSFKQIVKYLLVAGLISDTMCLLNLLLSAASGGWPLGFVTCEIWGFVSTTMLAFSAWLITMAVVERYMAILSPSEVPSAFSQRNTRIISVGIIFLIMMAATGPFYGFGEYTYLRGYLTALVSTNISLPLTLNQREHTADVKLQNLHELFSHLKRSSYTSPSTDMLSLVALHIHKNYDVIVSKAQWLSHGILFYLRAISSNSLESFMEHYRDSMLTRNITDLSFVDDIAKTLNISDTEMTSQLSVHELNNYRQIYLPVQDIGVCSADLTTPSHHASIWTGFYITFVFILPYSLSLAGLCLVYIRGFGYNSCASKRASDLDVSHTNITSTICMVNCIINLIYFLTILSNKNGALFSQTTVFLVTYIISLKTLPLVVTMRLGPTTCKCYCMCCNVCIKKLFIWKAAGDMSNELSDLEMRQSLTGKQKLSKVSA